MLNDHDVDNINCMDLVIIAISFSVVGCLDAVVKLIYYVL